MSESLEEILSYCRAKGRVCPMPQRWNDLWKILSEKKAVGPGDKL